MSNVLNDYKALSNTSPRNAVSDVLNAVINASPIAFDSATRTQLIQSIINDLNTCHYGGNGKSRLGPTETAQAILAVKNLGKHPTGSQCISSQSNLSILLRLSTLKDMDASNEALRCIANSMLLVEAARETFVQSDVGGRSAATELLEKSNSPDRIFLASRILFLATVSASAASAFIRSLVEDKMSISSLKTMLDVIGAKMDSLSLGILTGTKMAREAMTDLLKFVFNLLLHYPKIADSESHKGKASSSSQGASGEAKQLGEAWHPRLDDLLPPLLRVFNSLPPLFPSPLGPPLTHVVHSLIAIPVTDNLRPLWFPPSNPSSSKSTRASTPSSPRTSCDASPTEGPSSSKGSGPMDKALSVLAAGRRSLSRSPSPLPSSRSQDTLLRAYDLLEVSLSYYIPGKTDPDDISVRDRAKSDGDSTCDDLLSPLVLLLTRLCAADENSRKRMREWVVPADIDRTTPLEERADTLGRCLRLMSSVYHERLKGGIGEMLFTMFDSDASILSAHVGYGNVAGFLFNKGIMSAPPPPGSGDGISNVPENINPITGVVNQPRPDVQEEMTEEEKEREAEKLFVLFDRLEKTGALPPDQNPIRKAIKEGKVGGPGI